MHRRVRSRALIAKAALLAIALVAIASGCSRSPTTTTIDPADVMPCAEPAVRLSLGIPGRGGPVAEFTLNASPAWVTVVDLDETGFLETESGLVLLNVGVTTAYPTYDPQRGTVSESILELTVHEDDFSRLDLVPGRYWLWQTKGGTAIIASCEADGVSDPSPALP